MTRLQRDGRPFKHKFHLQPIVEFTSEQQERLAPLHMTMILRKSMMISKSYALVSIFTAGIYGRLMSGLDAAR